MHPTTILDRVTRDTHREQRARVSIHLRLARILGATDDTPCEHDLAYTGASWPNTYRYTATMFNGETQSWATATGVGPTTLHATLTALARLDAQGER